AHLSTGHRDPPALDTVDRVRVTAGRALAAGAAVLALASPAVAAAGSAAAAGRAAIAGSAPVSGSATAAATSAPAAINDPAATNSPAAAHVVLVGIGGLRWSDISPTVTPALWRLASEGAVGSLVVSGIHPRTCPADGWLTLNTAARAAVPHDATGPCPAPPAVTVHPSRGHPGA